MMLLKEHNTEKLTSLIISATIYLLQNTHNIFKFERRRNGYII